MFRGPVLGTSCSAVLPQDGEKLSLAESLGRVWWCCPGQGPVRYRSRAWSTGMEASRALVLDSGGHRGTAACLSDGQQRFGLGNKPSSQSQGRADPVPRGLVVLMLSPLPLTHTHKLTGLHGTHSPTRGHLLRLRPLPLCCRGLAC